MSRSGGDRHGARRRLADADYPHVAFAAAATISWRTAGNGLSTNLVVAVALMGGVSLFHVSSCRGMPADRRCTCTSSQCCKLVAYCDYRPILVGTVASLCIIWR